MEKEAPQEAPQDEEPSSDFGAPPDSSWGVSPVWPNQQTEEAPHEEPRDEELSSDVGAPPDSSWGVSPVWPDRQTQEAPHEDNGKDGATAADLLQASSSDNGAALEQAEQEEEEEEEEEGDDWGDDEDWASFQAAPSDAPPPPPPPPEEENIQAAADVEGTQAAVSAPVVDVNSMPYVFFAAEEEAFLKATKALFAAAFPEVSSFEELADSSSSSAPSLCDIINQSPQVRSLLQHPQEEVSPALSWKGSLAEKHLINALHIPSHLVESSSTKQPDFGLPPLSPEVLAKIRKRTPPLQQQVKMASSLVKPETKPGKQASSTPPAKRAADTDTPADSARPAMSYMQKANSSATPTAAPKSRLSRSDDINGGNRPADQQVSPGGTAVRGDPANSLGSNRQPAPAPATHGNGVDEDDEDFTEFSSFQSAPPHERSPQEADLGTTGKPLPEGSKGGPTLDSASRPLAPQPPLSSSSSQKASQAPIFQTAFPPAASPQPPPSSTTDLPPTSSLGFPSFLSFLSTKVQGPEAKDQTVGTKNGSAMLSPATPSISNSPPSSSASSPAFAAFPPLSSLTSSPTPQPPLPLDSSSSSSVVALDLDLLESQIKSRTPSPSSSLPLDLFALTGPDAFSSGAKKNKRRKEEEEEDSKGQDKKFLQRWLDQLPDLSFIFS